MDKVSQVIVLIGGTTEMRLRYLYRALDYAESQGWSGKYQIVQANKFMGLPNDAYVVGCAGSLLRSFYMAQKINSDIIVVCDWDANLLDDTISEAVSAAVRECFAVIDYHYVIACDKISDRERDAFPDAVNMSNSPAVFGELIARLTA